MGSSDPMGQNVQVYLEIVSPELPDCARLRTLALVLQTINRSASLRASRRALFLHIRSGRAALCSVCLAFYRTANAGQSAPIVRGRAHSLTRDFFVRHAASKKSAPVGADNSGGRFVVRLDHAARCIAVAQQGAAAQGFRIFPLVAGRKRLHPTGTEVAFSKQKNRGVGPRFSFFGCSPERPKNIGHLLTAPMVWLHTIGQINGSRPRDL